MINSEYNYKQFLKYLSATEEQNYKIEFVFNNEYIVPVQLNKQKVTDSGKLLGYVMINQVLTLSEIYKETVNNEYRKRQHIYSTFWASRSCITISSGTVTSSTR